jgi:flagellar biosynthesis protein FliQ
MSEDQVISLCVSAMELAMKIALPMLMVGLVVGLLVSIFQAVTQIQEQTLSFIPKIAGLAVVLVVAGPWMLGQLLGYTEELYRSIPALVGGG